MRFYRWHASPGPRFHFVFSFVTNALLHSMRRCSPTRQGGLELTQPGASESLGKASVRQAALLSVQGLKGHAARLGLQGGGCQSTRNRRLLNLVEYFAPGGVGFQEAALAHTLTAVNDFVELLVFSCVFGVDFFDALW